MVKKKGKLLVLVIIKTPFISYVHISCHMSVHSYTPTPVHISAITCSKAKSRIGLVEFFEMEGRGRVV